MIRPGTRLFGLVLEDPRVEGPVTRLYNALLGFNGHDAAYLSFVVKPEHLTATLAGFVSTGKLEVVHVAPLHQQATGRWLHPRGGPVDTLVVCGGKAEGLLAHPDAASWLQPDVVCTRAQRDLEAWFGGPPRVPPDWRAVWTETALRPCQLTHDTFHPEAPHADRRTP